MNKTNNEWLSPALLFGVGLFPLIVVCTDLKSALIYGVMLFLTMFLSQLLIGAFRLIISKRVRFICYTLVVLSVVYVLDSAVYDLFPKSYSNLHVAVVFLLAASVVFYSLETASKEESFGLGVKTVLKIATGYSLTMVVVGLVREILGMGSIWGKTLSENFSGLNFFSSFAGGLMIILILALIVNSIALALQKRAKIYNQLVERYEAVINSNKPQIDSQEQADEKQEDRV